MKMDITNEMLERFEQQFDSDRTNLVAMNTVTNNGILKSAQNYEISRSTRHQFSINLEQGSITNQKHSGRCWMFAGLNIVRFHIIQRWKLADLELSQNYLLFFDKLEKANYFLENIMETFEEDTDSRLIKYLLTNPIDDGGQWNMFCNIVKKYGIVPKDAMPETAPSSSTREMNTYLKKKLREYACSLRKQYKAGVSVEKLKDRKEKMIQDIYRILCICLGKPVKSFDFEITDKDNKLIKEKSITPLEFYDKYLELNLDEYISLINAPTKDKLFNQSYSVKYLGNVKDGNIIRYLNLEMSTIKSSVISQLKDQDPVWFGCDVGKCLLREEGIFDLNAYDMDALFGTKNSELSMTKGERIDYSQSLMTHAMIFLGVSLDEDGNSLRWRVENSYGKEAGKDGYCVMSDEWFNEYLYQVVVNKKYLSEEIIKQYNAEPIKLDPWDPMGALAKV